MSLTFGTSIAVNNLLALKAFRTYLFNYNQFEKPNMLEKWLLPKAHNWIEKQAKHTFSGLMLDGDAKAASVSLNDVSAGFFAILYLIQNPHLVNNINSGAELFALLAQMELEFVKVQKPRPEQSYEQK